MKKRVLALFLVAIITATLIPTTALADSDFVIENGVLTDYTGPGGDVVIPDGVTTIGNGAFYYCIDLTSVTIPNSVTSIEEEVFSGCTSLTSIIVAQGNPAYTSLDGVLFDKNMTTLILCPARKMGAYVIPAGVTSIGDFAFLGCESLTNITIPASVTSIGTEAFFRCTSLTSITIPKDVAGIGWGVFYGCTSLISITIPESVTYIGASAFYECFSLTSITIPESVTSIGDDAFTYCTSLTSMTIPEGVTSIGRGAFWGCENLTSVTIPAGVTSIGGGVFSGCTSLTVYGYADSEAERYCTEGRIPFVSLGIVPGTAQTGSLKSSGGKSVSWAVTKEGAVTVPSSQLASGEKVLVGCYNSQGRFTGVKWLDAQHATAQIDPNTPNVKLFWLDGSQSPLSASATVWGE